VRAVSQYTNHVIQIRPMRSRALGDGGVEVTQEPILAVFAPLDQGGFLYDNEKEAAEEHFNFHGLTQHIDEATPSDPAYRLSVFDLDEAAEREGWDEEAQELVKETLLRKAERSPQSILIITSTPIEAPFPAYDSFEGDPEQLVIKLIEDGFDLERVLHYERAFGPKRPEIMDALEEGVEALARINVSA
jgi:hypothetical protein